MTSLEKANKIKDILDSGKALEISVLKVKEKSVITDYFVIATGTSSTHVKALADEVEYQMEKEKILLKGSEGKISNSWILLDYNDVIVHIFSQEARDFYDLESLWSK